MAINQEIPVIVMEVPDPLVMQVADSTAFIEFTVSEQCIHTKYEGEYTVVPILYDDQVLETKDKLMMDDVTVKPIPVVYTTNPYNGKTVVIG